MAAEIPAETVTRIEDILTSIEQEPSSGEQNRRKRSRVEVRLSINAVLLSAVTHPMLNLSTRNISTAGIGFVSRRAFKPNELVVFPFKTKNLPPKLALAAVTFCRYTKDGLYEAGAEFLEACDHSTPDPHDCIPLRWLELAAPKTPKPVR